MRINLVFPAFPPALDGIGDYTFHLAHALSVHHDVRVLTAQPNPKAVKMYEVIRAFDKSRRNSILEVVPHVSQNCPDWVVIQYNPFSYGRWGLNPWITQLAEKIRRACPTTKIALMVHEPFVPVDRWQFAIMTTWQRWQLKRLGQGADIVLFSIESWASRFKEWFSGKTVHLPVSSNIPNINAERVQVREDLNFSDRDYVIGLFGSGHPSRLLPFVRKACIRIQSVMPHVSVLYVGPAGKDVRRSLRGCTVLDVGALPADEVSRHFSAMDLYLAPFKKGVSTRRGSFFVGLEHGVPTVSTSGDDTGEILRVHNKVTYGLASDNDAEAFATLAVEIALDADWAEEMGKAGAKLFNKHFSWSEIARQLLDTLGEDSDKKATSELTPRVDFDTPVRN